MSLCNLPTKPPAGPKRTKFVRMLLHHYVWWGRGEDYDEFERIRTSTCLSFESKLTIFFLWFPNGVYEFDDFPMLSSGVWVYFILNGAQSWWFLFKYFPNGGFWVYISVCNPRRYPEHWHRWQYIRIGWHSLCPVYLQRLSLPIQLTAQSLDRKKICEWWWAPI